MNPVRATTSFAKSKKQIKTKNKGQQQPPNANSQNDNDKDKGSPIKDYAGISPELTRYFAEQALGNEALGRTSRGTNSDQVITQEACNILTEDINYRLRHIIHECVVKGRKQGRHSITAVDVAETFNSLNIETVYGAPSSPNWLPCRDAPRSYLEDQKVNLIELAEEEFKYSQEGDIVIDQVWLPNETDSPEEAEANQLTLNEYFEAMCEAVISDHPHIRHVALLDISTNPSIGPITDWFYHFSYFLLIKDLTYDRLTMRALQLLEVLENSPLPSLHIYPKQLKLIVRLLLQRLLMSSASEDIVKHMAYVLSLFCLREPLKNMALNKVEDKFDTVCENMALPLLNIIYYLGIEAVRRIFVPNVIYFLARVVEDDDPSMTEIILAIYGLICKSNLNNGLVYYCFVETFGSSIIPYIRPKHNNKTEYTKELIDTVQMQKRLIKTRRKVDFPYKKTEKLNTDIFETTPHCCTAKPSKPTSKIHIGVCFELKKIHPCCSFREKLELHKKLCETNKTRRETKITIGKTDSLLSVFKPKHINLEECREHSLFGLYL
ncbi:unnamed protein product [Ceutorhynchus assimilis]|uniref:TATA box binding protein associated factor (TAF) histone-like fold domain-containing protein n=1 Tax=Ceutorhynchus assimilis TaxID=467358 RepID=A0A9P0DHM6_9CUCU|nr:unnamed protein product [Ceutorhynchus assimilis]